MKAAKGLIDWIRTGINEIASAIDAERESRLEALAKQVDLEFTRRKQAFVFDQVAEKLGVSNADRQPIAERVYRRFLSRTWSDLSLSDGESKTLDWVAKCLAISSIRLTELNREAASAAFRQVLATALTDGRISSAEAESLGRIAARCECTIPSMMSMFFRKEGEALLRSAFTQYTVDGKLEHEEWQQFLQTVELLGVPRQQMLHAIRQPAKQLIEHVLADARSDGEITAQEESVLSGLLSTVTSDADFVAYVRNQIAEAHWRFDIARGRLPSVPAPAEVALKAGEIVHFTGPVKYTRTRALARGTRSEEVDGLAVITDTRFILNGADKSLQISHRKVLGHCAAPTGLEIRSDGKGSGMYAFPIDDEKAVAIWRVAIGRANQTIVETGIIPTRHISRDVRQRVWQRYGGRCAECGATAYLEFDHIVPVAKGGSNSESNVQLLCRKCNLSKSDKI